MAVPVPFRVEIVQMLSVAGGSVGSIGGALVMGKRSGRMAGDQDVAAGMRQHMFGDTAEQKFLHHRLAMLAHDDEIGVE
jgi:hypothetical protein